jgi:hypothetical protein
VRWRWRSETERRKSWGNARNRGKVIKREEEGDAQPCGSDNHTLLRVMGVATIPIPLTSPDPMRTEPNKRKKNENEMLPFFDAATHTHTHTPSTHTRNHKSPPRGPTLIAAGWVAGVPCRHASCHPETATPTPDTHTQGTPTPHHTCPLPSLCLLPLSQTPTGRCGHHTAMRPEGATAGVCDAFRLSLSLSMVGLTRSLNPSCSVCSPP